MSPRKSSTSSAERTRSLRPRYLGIEVAGDPSFSTRWLETVLVERLSALRSDRPPTPVRVIRREGMRAIAEVAHLRAPDARSAWNAKVPAPPGPAFELRTTKTWGTLRGAKAWLRSPTSRGLPGRGL